MDLLICFGETQDIDEEGSFSNSKVSHKIAIVAAGAIVNIIFAILLYFSLFSISGVNSTTEIQSIIPEFASEQTSLQAGDKILRINGKKMRIKADVDSVLYQSNGEDLQILVNRNGEEITLFITPIKYQNGDYIRYLLGVEVAQAEKNLRNNVYYGFWNTVEFVGSMGESLKMIFTGKVTPKQMTGPIGISEMVVKTSGAYDFVYLMAMVSLSLGVTNLLPIPALDGGKIVILLIEAVRKKKMSEDMELQIQSIGFTLLILLSLYVSWNDIIRIF